MAAAKDHSAAYALMREHGFISGQLRATKNKKERLRLLERLRIVGEKILKLEHQK